MSNTEQIPPEQAIAIRDTASSHGATFDRMDTAREERIQFTMLPGGRPSTQVDNLAQGWQLISADGRTQATVMPGALIVQTTNYHRWSTSLRAPLEALLHGIASTVSPAISQRIGLRYVDRFVDPAAVHAQSWMGRIDPQLLGAVCHDIFGEKVVSAQQQMELRLGDGQGAVLRHGPFLDQAAGGAVSYLLDIDVFEARSETFEAEHVVTIAETLNRTALSLFQNSLTQEYLVSMRPTDPE